MEQRPLRLGDLVDDYCPRERRLTDHAIVAIVGEEIRQTRCTTCEAEHVYKGGKAPIRKKKDATAVLYDQVLANATAGAVVAAVAPTPPEPPEPPPPPADEVWTLHRTLIRATLPRTPEAVATQRPIPEFTMHQRNVRGSHMFRQPNGFHANGNGNGDGPPRNHFRGDAQPGAPNGGRPGGSGRRRRRNKKARPVS
ncbi:MAG: hypothetical protein FJW21_10110 [Acidimicrobiia bacterium]|nr:hypothetical protein [Acidimicrobiia bacterium]